MGEYVPPLCRHGLKDNRVHGPVSLSVRLKVGYAKAKTHVGMVYNGSESTTTFDYYFDRNSRLFCRFGSECDRCHSFRLWDSLQSGMFDWSGLSSQLSLGYE